MPRIIISFSLFCVLVFLAPLTNAVEIGVSLYHDFANIQEKELLLERLVDAKIGWVKIELRMDLCEPEKGVFEWPEEEINALAEQDIEIFASISYAPTWANGGRSKEYPCVNPGDWYNFVKAAVEKFDAQIDHWGIWNEPGSQRFFKCDSNNYVQYYVDNVLLQAAQAIKEAPGINFVVAPQTNYEYWGEVNPVGNNGVEFLKQVFQRLEDQGKLDMVDIIAHHIFKIYEESGWANFRRYMYQNGIISLIQYYKKLFWVGDLGWSVPPEVQSERAKWFTDAFDELSSGLLVNRCFVYMFNDNQYVGDYYGMTYDGEPYKPKKHYYTIRDYLQPQRRHLTYHFEQSDFFHIIGQRNSVGWEARTSYDDEGWMAFGPYTTKVKAGYREAIFTMMIDNNTINNDLVALLEIGNPDYSLPIAQPGKVIASKLIYREDFPIAGELVDIVVPFYHHGGDDRLEFRVYWFDKAYLLIDKVVIPALWDGELVFQ
ncbi:hypothetical protein ACFL27_03355 [candidate division CSSED10-310 bacterium]|uniref:Glycoside hydrolase family 42 N-terminal domain-containing protein n=1 Tax=candidate division CSSED10-310 bacterium TaxID=2855610 RepID=A0ABV6YT02_UNCC1